MLVGATEHNGSTVQVLLISLITIWWTLGLDEMPRGPLSTSETDGTRSYKYQPAISHMCIGNSRVTNTRLLLLPLLVTMVPYHLLLPLPLSRRVLFKRFVPLLRAHLHRRLRTCYDETRRKLERMGERNEEKKCGVTNLRAALLNNPYPSIRARREYVCTENPSVKLYKNKKPRKLWRTQFCVTTCDFISRNFILQNNT